MQTIWLSVTPGLLLGWYLHLQPASISASAAATAAVTAALPAQLPRRPGGLLWQASAVTLIQQASTVHGNGRCVHLSV